MGEITIGFKPLKQEDKIEIIEKLTGLKEGTPEFVKAVMEMSIDTLKSCLKSVEGVYYSDDEPWELELEDDKVTEDSMTELLSLEESGTMLQVVMAFFNSYPADGIIRDDKGNPIEGISIIKSNKGKK